MNDQTIDNLSQCVDIALHYAASKGADQAEVAATEDSGLSISARMRDIETLEYQNDRGLGLSVYLKKAKGSASTADFSEEAIRQAVDKALSIASQTTADDCAGLADESMLAVDPPKLALDFPWQVGPEQVRELALECEAAALDSDARISNSEGGAVSTGQSFVSPCWDG
ncbi:MAG: DNA gyrase modulator [Pseudomonadota bacterium]